MTSLFLAAAIVAAGQAFPCHPVRVWDGDGPVWCAEGPRLRLAAIAAREHDESCRRGQPCPRFGGIAARDVLVRLLGGARGMTADGHVIVGGPALACRSEGPDRYGRTVAWCAVPGIGDLSCAMVRAGAALRWPAFGGDRVCSRRGR